MKIIDFLRAQFQDKRIDSLMKSQGHLLAPLKQRKVPIDDDVVFVQDVQTREFICVHDSELKNPEPEKLPDNVKPIKPRKVKNDGPGTN